MDISGLMSRLFEVTAAAGKRLLSQSVTVKSHKSRNDLLTENDLWIEEFILGELKKDYPGIHIISEEYNPNNTPDGLTVVIDPIDGTCNFAAGLPLFGIQTAIFEHNVCQGALLYFPTNGDTLTAERGKGAFYNGKRLQIAADTPSSDGILLISDYYEGMSVSFEKQFALVKALQAHFLKTRHFGAACVDFSMLAKGNALAYITYYHKIWDIAPGLLVAREAGCVFASLDKDTYEYGNPGLVVANNAQTLETIRKVYRSLASS